MPTQNQRIYLDYNATAPVHSEVMDKMCSVLALPGNASSVHLDGRTVRSTIEDSRDSISKLVGFPSSSITFTSGGTEANATIIKGLLDRGSISKVYCSSIEHPSVYEHVPPNCRIGVDRSGVLDLEQLAKLLSEEKAPILLCLMLANNETGVIQPVREAATLVHEFGGLLLCDAVQGPGKTNFSFESLGADFYALSAHKIGGPQGVGCIVSGTNTEPEPLLLGGGQERRRRSGTENAPGIAGFGVAARSILAGDRLRDVEQNRNKLEAELLAAKPDAVIFGQETSRLVNTTNIALPGVSSEQQVIRLDLAGFSVSAGSACSSGKVSTSHVLLAMGVAPELAASAIRISIGPDTEWAELEKFVDVWATL